MVEVFRNNGSWESLKNDDLILVIREDEKQEVAVVVDRVDKNGTVWMNYGGYIDPLHDSDQVRIAPEELREALILGLKQNGEELNERLNKTFAPFRKAFEDNKKGGLFAWIGKIFTERKK